jgi:TetR/AcrR family transcriptional regulator, fatty acid metabolism regulator protein
MAEERLSRGEESKARLFQAASRLFAGQGYAGTKISDIVAEAGVSQPTFYAYFESKEALFVELVATFREGLRHLVTILQLPESASVAEQEEHLRRTHIAIFEYLALNPVMTRIGLLQAPDGAEVYRGLAAILATTFQHSQQLGLVRAELDADLIAESIVGMVHQLTVRYLLTGERTPLELAEFSLDVICYGTHTLPPS